LSGFDGVGVAGGSWIVGEAAFAGGGAKAVGAADGTLAVMCSSVSPKGAAMSVRTRSTDTVSGAAYFSLRARANPVSRNPALRHVMDGA
jgi:hypothetical protein